ncbi:hypothetical protein ACHAWF_009289, partial [Thalassiosira exigua]
RRRRPSPPAAFALPSSRTLVLFVAVLLRPDPSRAFAPPRRGAVAPLRSPQRRLCRLDRSPTPSPRIAGRRAERSGGGAAGGRGGRGSVVRLGDDAGGRGDLGGDEGRGRFGLPPRLASALSKAATKFRSRPHAYLLIPPVAALVGWITNYLAVQMIFYPVNYRGFGFWRGEEMPLGLLGWQGIVPCKARTMSESMVKMVTEELLDVEGVFRRLDPKRVAETLSPEVPKLMQSMVADRLPFEVGAKFSKLTTALFFSLPGRAVSTISDANRRFLRDLAVGMQDNVLALLNVKNCVVDQMVRDRSKLGILFRKCGQAELDFLTNSGLWFGFLLGIVQMVVALFWENPWALSVGGTIVGLATNWLALKWIFEPVEPTQFGPFLLQGQFLRRQREVAREFSTFFANNVLTSERLWGSILTDPSTSPAFDLLFANNFRRFASVLAGGFGVLRLPGKLANEAAREAVARLPGHLPPLHPYVDRTLGLRGTLRTEMELMSSWKFERVLHPIFEEDELTLILAGGFLGFAAGLIQQGIETGNIWEWTREVRERAGRLRGRVGRLFGTRQRNSGGNAGG